MKKCMTYWRGRKSDTVERPGRDAPLFAVVLPDGEVLDPRVLIGI
jgi:hypothetical protein